MTDQSDLEDKDVLFRKRFDKMQRLYLKSLVCDEVIEEHRKSPLGYHSEPLGRLLYYFQRRPLNEQYAIKRDSASGHYRLVALSGVRGVAPKAVDDELYASVDAAYHSLFMKHVEDLMGS